MAQFSKKRTVLPSESAAKLHVHTEDHVKAARNQQALLVGFLLISGFMVVEFFGGLISGSLTLLSDAAHMLSDSISLAMSLAAFMIGTRVSADNRKTFGYRRFEILAALFNGVLLMIISAAIIIEACFRIAHPEPVASMEMLLIALIGLITNIVVAIALMRGESAENLNIRSALVHVLGDLLGSVGAIAAALLIYFWGWQYADPAASIFVSLIILHSGWKVSKEAVNILMEGRPDTVNLQEIRRALCRISGVISLHDLHIWSITSGFFSLSCHLTVANDADRDRILREAEQILSAYNLGHSTIQMEGDHFSGCTSDCAHEHQKGTIHGAS